MNFKQVATFPRRLAGSRNRRLRRVLQPLLIIRIAASILMLPQSVGAEDTTAANSPLAPRLDITTAQSTESLLASVFRTQSTAGLYGASDDGGVLLTRPFFATMALDAYSTTRNPSALAHAANSVARYYGYLFSTADRDGDRLLETPSKVQGKNVLVETPAFNAIAAIDARNLSRINLELRRTMQALYWYDSARAIERALVAATFDPDHDYCFARDPASGKPLRDFAPAAALPAGFTLAVGSNYATRMRSHVVTWCSQAVVNVEPADRDANALDFMTAVAVLGDGDHAAVIEGIRQAMPLASAAATPVERYALARSRVDFPLFEDDIVFALLLNVSRNASISDAERFRVERALPQVRALALASHTPPMALDEAEGAIRTAYTAIATVRDRLRATSFYRPEDRKAFSGADPGIATQRLLDDATLVVHRAENRLFEMRYPGARVQGNLAEDRVVALDRMKLRWEVGASKEAVGWKGISAGIFGEALVPVKGAPFTITSGAPLRFSTQHLARGGTGALRMLTLTAVLESPAGVQSRVHFDRSVYLNAPLGATARFPQGRTMASSSVPIQLVLRRHSSASEMTKYFWFSPSGLRLTEGNSGVIRFGQSDSTVVTLHIEVPSPCRPGVFPFTLKFMAGDRDAGTIASSLFKPYQWTFVGPFADGGLDKVHPPELGVNLLQDYPGPNGSARWHPVPESACDPRGGISLQSLASDRGVQYLYTIVSCAYETTLKARLWSNAPASLIVNGRRAVTIGTARGDSAVANIHLDPDLNHILIKVIGDRDARVSFALGNDDNLAADEFDNNLSELAGGYRELTLREMSMGSAPDEARRLVTLRFQDAEAQSVAVVGSFNGWSPASNPMQKKGDVWELTLSLAPGKYSYRFLVDQKKQVLDKDAKGTEPDGYGGKNSVLVINK